ncbi:MAG: hypothetical protein QM504_10320 [Pseudomonadota bacterium]
MANNTNKVVVRNFLAKHPLMSKGSAHVVTNKQIRHKQKQVLKNSFKLRDWV